MPEQNGFSVSNCPDGEYLVKIRQYDLGRCSKNDKPRLWMQVELLMNLVPTGELVNISVVRSSGNAAFDRSAELAVSQAAPFEVPDNPALFEQRFRQLRLLFTPEDLRNR